MTKKLQRKIENKLDKLSKLLDKFEEARIINSDDPETWDSDALYNLTENLKAALALLEDEESKTEKDEFGQPLTLEEGLCTLVDAYQSEDERRGLLMKKVQEQVLNLTQIKALCLTPSNLHCQQRHDKLLETVLLMAYLGLRVSEAINFTWQQVPVEDKQAFLVNGKGNKQRLVFNLLNNSYLTKKAKSNSEKDTWKTISRIAVWNYLKKKSSELNLTWTITPHTLRHSFASILHYDLGLDSSSIQQLLGHSQFRTTEKYLKKDVRFLLTNLQRKGFLL